ncbi:MAG TPA: cupin domain-containing protein [Acidimicrobiia bacterium]
MVDWAVVRGEEAVVGDAGVTELVGVAQGAVHLDGALVTLSPGERRDPEVNAFEESFYVLNGRAMLQLAGQLHDLGPDDFGYVPVAVAHRWENRADQPVTLLRVRSPQPRDFGIVPRSADLAELDSSVVPTQVDASDPASRLVGHFSEDHLPNPGPLQMKGFRSGTAKNVGLWMLVDEVVGAVHHTLFMVQFAPTGQTVTLGGQHYHPFEEIYYIVEGEAVAHLEDQSIPVGVGDAVFAGVNSLHGFSNQTDSRVRWIEAQAPAPPPAGAFFFPSQWAE